MCVWRNYPEEQVEEEEHVFNAADATTSHGRVAGKQEEMINPERFRQFRQN